MWSIDANRCPACPKKEECKDRKKLLPALSTLANELNTNPEHVDGPGDGIIILACKETF